MRLVIFHFVYSSVAVDTLRIGVIIGIICSVSSNRSHFTMTTLGKDTVICLNYAIRSLGDSEYSHTTALMLLILGVSFRSKPWGLGRHRIWGCSLQAC
jgi:hypothetical protein